MIEAYLENCFHEYHGMYEFHGSLITLTARLATNPALHGEAEVRLAELCPVAERCYVSRVKRDILRDALHE